MTLTHRRHTPDLNNQHVMLFCDSDNNDHYGDHVWTLRTNLPDVDDRAIEFCSEFFGVDLNEASNLLNPTDIVDSAGAWDDPQFVSELWHFCGEPIGFRTPDGAVVLDRESVKITKSN